MARLAKQIGQVLMTYATRPRTWTEIWVPLGCIAFTFGIHRGDPQGFSLFVGFFAGTMFAGLVRDQTHQQFAHPRSALLPGFALPHLLAVIAFALFATVLVPVIVTMTLTGEFLFMAAVASFTFALTSGQYKFIHGEHLRTVFPTLMVVVILILYLFAAMALWGNHNTALTPVSSITLIVASWTFMAVNFVRLVRLREDETTFQASGRSVVGRRLEAGHWYLYGLVSDLKWYTRKWILSDMWNDRIGGFHHGVRLRIIRLLRHGCSPWPPELPAAWIFAFCAGCTALFIYASGHTEFPAIWRLFPVLIMLSVPGPLASGLVARHRSILAVELLRPLSRKQFINGWFGASWCTFAVLWISFNTFAFWVLWTFPSLAPSLSRIATFVFLSAALSVAMFGFALYSPACMPLFLRMLMSLFFLIAWFTVLPWWWFMRDTITDSPFWIVGTLALSLGLWAARQARLAWLNVELGINRIN